LNQILIISWREVTRLRKRFAGATPLAALGLLVLVGLSAFALRDTIALGSGLYQIGVAGDAPPIHDNHFTVIPVEAEQGRTLLKQHVIDVSIDGTQVFSRADNKSQYAIRALKRYLAEEELTRIGNTYPEAEAFPLRVGINYLPASQASGQSAAATRPEETIIPSLTSPPLPFAQVLIAMLYIFPITFISIFFTSSFMDEKLNRRLTVLLSAPVTPFQIILGKMLPYAVFVLSAIAVIAVLTRGKLLLTLAIFVPTTLFLFAIYLMVPLFYRTFKDTTFIAMLVTTLTTAYLVAPAMFTDVNDISYISPLTLAVKMYRNEAFGWREYTFSALPMVAIFGFAMFAGTRLLNEEFLMGYKPFTRKISDAIYLLMAHASPYWSVPLGSLLIIPLVYMAQIVFLAFASNLPSGLILAVTLMASALMEEVAKSVGIVVLAEHGMVKSTREIVALSLLSALGFFIGEKLLVFLSINMVTQASISSVLFGQGLFLLAPLIAHGIFTTLVALLKTKANLLYMAALAVGTLVHFLYNWYLLGGLR
jgi:ABC-type Na+ efflux pump permease subunit